MYPQVFGKYVLERELARGGMARVLLATLRGAGGFEKRLVVKQIRDDLALDEDFVRRFVEEAKTTVALSHPNIVPVYELGVERGTYFLAMELVEGVCVSELLQGEKGKTRLTPEEGAYIGVEICRALDYAHRRMQVVHRDITPRNVMIDEEGQIKLIDFGIAAHAVKSASRERQIFGSPGHMPPEQMAGKKLGPATDLFAVAVLLMEAWSGRAPFRRKTAEECEAAMQATHPKPSDADIRLLPLDEPILRAMSLDPEARQQDADELGRALRTFLQGVDLGDVARALGDRARDVRARAKAREDRTTTPELQSASTPTPAESGTATFAARDEIRKLSEAPPAPDAIDAVEIGTRKLAFLTPALPISKEELGKLAPKPASTPDEIEDVKVETVATAPIETPVHRREPRSPEKQARSRLPLYGGAVVLVASALWYQSTRGAPTPRGANDAPPKPTEPATTTASATASATTPTPTTSARPGTTAPTASAAPTTSASSAAAAVEDGKLSLFGDPGTKAFVDGVSRGACPLRNLPIASGTHDVKFVFEPTGEARSEQIKVPASGHASLRADFTGATPMIHVGH